ncbi:MAG: hypothetical protein NDJ89_10880 [Oligoflexia bacterium]|nr:hypothetical protein [Oligoflexia bacterium]
MDLADRLRVFEAFNRLQRRVRALQEQARKRLPKPLSAHPLTRSRIRGAIFLLVSLWLGSIAYSIAETEAMHAWEKAHPPSRAAWEHSLGTRGYQEAKDARAIHKSLVSMPALVDEAGAIWMTSTGSWIAIPLAGSGNLPFRLFCRECSHPGEAWEPRGRGWRGFENVLAAIDSLTPPPPAAPAPRKPREIIDPREIRY